MPVGLYTDLIDFNIDFLRLGISDNISGYTRQQLFDGLTSDIFNLNDYRQNLQPNLPAGNTNQDFADLFQAFTQ